MNDPLRVGVIGLGVGEQHVEGFLRAGAAVRVVCDHALDRAAAVAARHAGIAATTDADAVIADPELDVIAIASFDDDHAAQVLGALAAGKHVFCEKPLCRTPAELRAIAARAATRPDLRLTSNLVLREAPLYRWAADAIAAGRLGRLYSFDGDYLYGRLPKLTHGWRGAVDGYSVLLGGGVHLVDLMLGLAGERPVAVTAVGNRIATEGTDFRYRDFAAATFTFSSGLVGRITANFGCVHPHQHVVRVFGTGATLVYDDAGARLHEHRDPPVAPTAVAAAPLPDSKAVLIPGFLDAIRRGESTAASTRRELDLITVCLAAEQALDEGAAVDIEYV